MAGRSATPRNWIWWPRCISSDQPTWPRAKQLDAALLKGLGGVAIAKAFRTDHGRHGWDPANPHRQGAGA